MRIYAKVKPNAGKKEVREVRENEFEISVTASPQKGEANKQVIVVLSKYFKTAKSNIEIIGGKSSRKKIIDVKI